MKERALRRARLFRNPDNRYWGEPQVKIRCIVDTAVPFVAGDLRIGAERGAIGLTPGDGRR